MARLATVASASTVTTLRKRVRRLVGDNSTVSSRQRWSDNDIDQAIIDQLSAMYAELAIDPSAFLTSTTMSYTANSESVVMPTAVLSSPIHRIEDYTDSDLPFELLYLSPATAENYTSPVGAYAWTRRGDYLHYLPKPTEAKTLRIWYVTNPILPYASGIYDASGDPNDSAPTTDTHPYPVAHEELIGVGAAIRLQEEDDEIPSHRLVRYEELWDRFRRQSRLNQGKHRVANIRRYY